MVAVSLQEPEASPWTGFTYVTRVHPFNLSEGFASPSLYIIIEAKATLFGFGFGGHGCQFGCVFFLRLPCFQF